MSTMFFFEDTALFLGASSYDEALWCDPDAEEVCYANVWTRPLGAQPVKRSDGNYYLRFITLHANSPDVLAEKQQRARADLIALGYKEVPNPHQQDVPYIAG